MSIGRSASITLTVGGATPSTFGQAALLTINPGGDHLTIDAALDRLQITAGFMTFTGDVADPEDDGALIFAGLSAAFVVGAQDIETETLQPIITQTSTHIETES